MKRLLRGLGMITFWGVVAVVAYAVYTNVEKETALWISALIIGIGVSYEFQTIKEKLDAIQWRLDDLRQGRYEE